MGVVIPFERMKRARQLANPRFHAAIEDGELLIADAIREAPDASAVLAVAHPLLDQCRDRYGFVVMRDGLSKDPVILGRVLIELFRGLSLLDTTMAAPRTYPTFNVYFGRRELAWFEDGYGGSIGLAVPHDINADALAAFVEPRIDRRRSYSLE